MQIGFECCKKIVDSTTVCSMHKGSEPAAIFVFADSFSMVNLSWLMEMFLSHKDLTKHSITTTR